MTEKRFTMDYEPTYQDVMYLDYDEVMTNKEVLNTLNELYNENEQLKKELHQQEVSEQRRKEYDDFWKEKISKVIE